MWEYTWDFSGKNQKVTGAILPNKFYRELSCCSMGGVEVHNLPHMILLGQEPNCKMIVLGDGSGSICTHCGKKESCSFSCGEEPYKFT